MHGTARVNQSKIAFAKVVLLFFAVLFTAVLIHPDVDLLAVHDVKITTVRSQVRPLDRLPVQLVPSLPTSPDIAAPQFSICLGFAWNTGGSNDQPSSSVLRI
jgi:hypothetical protein